MFTCYLGKGDKETFAYAFMSVGEPYSLVRTPPRAIGTTGMCELHSAKFLDVRCSMLWQFIVA